MADIIFRAARAKITQILLFGAIAISFAFVGMEAYVQTPVGQDIVAEVGDQRITTGEFDQAVRQQQERFRGMLGANYDPRMFDNDQMRQSVLDELVNQKLVVAAARKTGALVSDVALRDRIMSDPIFQQDGAFNDKRYAELLKGNNLSRLGYENSLRRDLERSLFIDSISRTSLASSKSAEIYARALEQAREVSVVQLTPDQFAAKVKVDADTIKNFYEQNKALYTTPEQVRAEYVELSIDALAAGETVTAEEIKATYDGKYAARFAEKQAARKKAEEILAKVRREPQKFADLAKEFSQDPGSAQNGGSLGFFGRGAMVKPFEDTVFGKLKENQVSDLVETDFGFHIIKLTAIKPRNKDAQEQREAAHILINAPKDGLAFDLAKVEIERTLKRERGAKRFAEIAQAFSDKVFEQSTALKPVAEFFKLQVRVTPWMTKNSPTPPFNNPKLSAALFSEEVLRNKRNTEAVEAGTNVLIAARIAESRPAELRPLATVEQEIARRLTRQEAGKLAKQDGEAKLKLLKEGKDAGLTWPATLAVSRQNTGSLPPTVLEPLLKASVKQLPAYVGVSDAQGGYALVKISKVVEAQAMDETKLLNMRARSAQTLAQEELMAMLAALRKEEGVKIRKGALEKKPE